MSAPAQDRTAPAPGGAIPTTPQELVRKYGGDADLGGPADLAGRFRYRDFAHFIDVWTWKNRFLLEYEDFTLVAEAVARDLAAQRIRYTEVFFSPGDFARHAWPYSPWPRPSGPGWTGSPTSKSS